MTDQFAARRPQVSRADLVRDLKTIGVRRGDHLAVGVAYKRVGSVEGGPGALIDALVEAVGPDGTLMMNTFTEFFYEVEVARGWVDYVFDVDSTRGITGIVPETLRMRLDSLRSRHPTNSVAATGMRADFLTQGHDECADAYLPYARLAQVGGKYLAVGIGDRLVGFRHQAQHAAGLLQIVPWVRTVRFKGSDGETGLFTLRDRGGCTKRLTELVQDLRDKDLVQQGTIGTAPAILVPARESLQVMTAALTSNPERNLCHSVSCYWCRELERRLELFPVVQHPRYFQKSRLAVRVIALMNYVREADSPLVGRAKGLMKRQAQRRRRRMPSS